jgi:hypothetical protein
MYEAAATFKDIARAPVTNWEPRGVSLADYYAVRYGMKIQLVTPYRVTHVQRYEVKLRSNVTSVYPPEGVGLRPFACWDCGFESRRVHGILSVVSVVCCLRRADRSSRRVLPNVVCLSVIMNPV